MSCVSVINMKLLVDMFDSHGIVIKEISLFTKMFQNLRDLLVAYDGL